MLIVVQNDQDVPAAAFERYLAEHAITFRIVRPYGGQSLPDVSTVSAAIVLGGAMGVHDTERHPFLAPVQGFIQAAVSSSLPFLGICLGGQLLAHVLGAPVTPSSCGEKGTRTVRLTPEGRRDPLFAGIPEEMTTFQWHDDSFSLPTGAVLLASSRTCAGQAFRFGDNAYGLQFHPEVDQAVVTLWSGKSTDASAAGGRYLNDFISHEHEYRCSSRRLLENFLAISAHS